MRILCAVDGSECSQWEVQTLEALAEMEPKHVALLHVINKPSLQAAKGKMLPAEKRALVVMEKAGQLLLREAERLAKVALGQAATGPSTAFLGLWPDRGYHRPTEHGSLIRLFQGAGSA